ncbi:histone H2B-like [Acipenser oxyrinchus oxyrinchus]|uniref:Histone H2B-like n=1 Tax=Acipenser oxyrinchus oxyrinchus TaxID=40147 RepID=A0AAD8DCQ5_ACIOX|nr:histone H2B-like [Acipenser oxyrinchus oxyrinchus]
MKSVAHKVEKRPTKPSCHLKGKKKANYSTYIYRVLKQLFVGSSGHCKLMGIVDCSVGDLFQRVALEASRSSPYNKRRSLTGREIQSAVQLLHPGELGTHDVSEGDEICSRVHQLKLRACFEM